MDQIIRSHLLFLADQLHQLQRQLTSPTTPPANIPLIKEEIQFRQDALAKLRRALELEERFRERKSPTNPNPRPQDKPSRKP